jgi:hypothetical protein
LGLLGEAERRRSGDVVLMMLMVLRVGLMTVVMVLLVV